ncbi:MAG: autotransporter-associated beta strand repeat-containing protein, partial [Planctomycetes bacterium]|nr:autotransporter-associated beta strand repeat-containing protein [Planctomycetota bacterium]
MARRNGLSLLGLLVAVTLGLVLVAPALGDQTKDNNTTNLNLVGSWVGGVVPGAGDVAIWDNTVTAANTTVLGANLSWLGIRILDPGGLVTIYAGNTLTLGTSGIDMTAATQNLTLNCPLTLGGAQAWDVTSGGLLTVAGTVATGGNLLTVQGAGNTTISGVVSGTGALAKAGTGTLLLSGVNAFTGLTTIEAGTVELATTGALPGPVLVNGPGTLLLDRPTTGNKTFAQVITGTGLVKVVSLASGTAVNTYLTGVSGFNGTIELANTGGIKDKWNTGAQNAPGVTVKIDSGSQLYVAPGAGNTATFAAVEVIGTGNTETRGAIRLGSGTLAAPITLMGDTTFGIEGGNISGAITSGVGGSQTLTLGTSNSHAAATLSGNIGGGTGTIALNVTNNSTITLSGTNTYSGPTTITAGTLRATPGVGLPAASNLVLAGGVLQSEEAATLDRDLGTGVGQVQWTAGGGFSASGGKLTVTLGGGTTTGIFTGLMAGKVSSNGNWTAENPGDLGLKPDPEMGFINETGWPDNVTFVYTGQYWSDGSIDNWCTDIDDGGYVIVGDTVVCSKTNNGFVYGSTVDLGGAGWQDVEIRVSNGGGAGGATRGAPGVGIDPTGLETAKANFTEASAGNVQYRYVVPMEPGSDPLGLGTLVWGVTPGFVASGKTLIFGSATADAETEFRNPINLNGGTQTVQVNAGTGTDFANLSGALSNGNLIKAGAGRLVLSAANPGLTGTTTVSAGTLELQHASALVASPVILTGTGALNLNTAGCQLVSVTAANTAAVNLNVAGSLGADLSFAGGQVNYNVDNAGGNHTITIAGTDLQTNLGTLTVAGTVTTLGDGLGGTDVLAVNGGNLLVINSANPALLFLDRTTNLTLAPGAILSEPVPGGAIAATIANLGTDNDIIRGMGADMDDSITLGNSGGGTPYLGLSSDREANRHLRTGTLTVDTASGATGAVLQGINNQALILGNGTTLSCVTIMPNANDTTATITTYGKVTLDDNAAVFGDSAAGKVVAFRVANGSTLLLNQSGALGSGTGIASGVTVESGGLLDLTGTSSINSNVSLESGGGILVNESGNLNGTGTITQVAGAINRLGQANALTTTAGTALALQSPNTVPGSIVRLEADNINLLDDGIDDAAIFTFAGANRSQNPTNGPGLTLDASGGVGGVLTLADTASNRTFTISAITVGAGGATFAAPAGRNFTLAAVVNAAGNPVTINSATPIDGQVKTGRVSFSGAFTAGSLTLANAGTAYFTGTVAISGNVMANSVAGSVVSLNNASSNVLGDIRIGGVGSVLFVGGGGTSDQVGNLGPRLTDTTGLVANRVADTIYIDDGARVELGLRDDNTPKNPEGRIEVTQPFVITGDVNPTSKRSFYVTRRQGPAVPLPVTLMDLTIEEGGVFAVQENNTDVRAYLKLNGSATITQFDQVQFENITNVTSPSTPITLTWGRVGDTAVSTEILGTIDANVSLNIVNGTLIYRGQAADPSISIDVSNSAGILAIYQGQDGSPGVSPLTQITLSNGGWARLYVNEVGELPQIVNTLDALVTIEATGGQLDAARTNDTTFNGIGYFKNVTVEADGATATPVVISRTGGANTVANLDLEGNAIVTNVGGGGAQALRDVTGLGGTPSTMEIGGAGILWLTGKLTNVDVVITDTNLVRLADWSTLPLADPMVPGDTTFDLNGRTMDVQAGTLQIGGTNTGWFNANGDPITSISPNNNLDPGSGIINLTRAKIDIYSGQDGAMGAWGGGLVVNVNPEGTTPTLSSL